LGEVGRNYIPLVEFAYNNSYQSTIDMPPFEALYGRKCRSLICWEEVGDRRIFGPDIILEAIDKIKLIKERMKAAQSRQKAYADNRRRPLKFEVGDKVFLKVSPMKGVRRADNKNKLAPRYVRPFEIYWIELDRLLIV